MVPIRMVIIGPIKNDVLLFSHEAKTRVIINFQFLMPNRIDEKVFDDDEEFDYFHPIFYHLPR